MDDQLLTVGRLRNIIWPYQDGIPIRIRLMNGNFISHGVISLENEKEFVISVIPSPEAECCPSCNTPIAQHLDPLPNTACPRCPTCCPSLFRIRSQKLYWSNKINDWVSNPADATLFASKNDPSLPEEFTKSSQEWEEIAEATVKDQERAM